MKANARPARPSWIAACGAAVCACSGATGNLSSDGAGSRAMDGAPGETANSSEIDGTVPVEAGERVEAGGQVEAGQPVGVVADGNVTAPADAAPADDPCPTDTFVALECDPACGDADVATCASAGCGLTHSVSLPAHELPYVIRTPSGPGTDAACASQCPGSGYVYGLGFVIPDGPPYRDPPTAFQVSVDPPWVIITDSPSVSSGHFPTRPYCDVPDADVESNCVSFVPGASGSIYVMTKDPAAPARNISFQASPAGATPAGCPSH